MEYVTRVSDISLVELAEQGRGLELRRRLDAGADVNERASDGRVPLHAALAEGEEDIVQLLLDAGADTTIVDSSGWGIVHWAAISNSRSMLSLIATKTTSIDVVDNTGATPLAWAAQLGDCIAIDWLIEQGADPNVVDLDSWAPLHHASAGGHIDAVRCLLECGARSMARLSPTEGETYGHLASDLARHYHPDNFELHALIEAAETAECEGRSEFD